MYIGVCANERASDNSVWERCSLISAIGDGRVSCPPTESQSFSNKVCPHIIVADDACPLKRGNGVIPGANLNHEHSIHNHRLARTRRVSRE